MAADLRLAFMSTGERPGLTRIAAAFSGWEQMRERAICLGVALGLERAEADEVVRVWTTSWRGVDWHQIRDAIIARSMGMRWRPMDYQTNALMTYAGWRRDEIAEPQEACRHLVVRVDRPGQARRQRMSAAYRRKTRGW